MLSKPTFNHFFIFFFFNFRYYSNFSGFCREGLVNLMKHKCVHTEIYVCIYIFERTHMCRCILTESSIGNIDLIQEEERSRLGKICVELQDTTL